MYILDTSAVIECNSGSNIKQDWLYRTCEAEELFLCSQTLNEIREINPNLAKKLQDLGVIVILDEDCDRAESTACVAELEANSVDLADMSPKDKMLKFFLISKAIRHRLNIVTGERVSASVGIKLICSILGMIVFDIDDI